MSGRDNYTPIDCALHDYVEIACLHGYRLLIELTDGRSFNARAVAGQPDKAAERIDPTTPVRRLRA